MGELPDHVRRGLLHTVELNRALEPVLHLSEATHIFTPTGLSLDGLPESAQDLYDTISRHLGMLQRSGLEEHEMNRLLHLDIQYYFQRFADEEQAVQWANDVRFGLASSVFTGSIGKAMRTARRLQFGTVWINEHFTLASETPHGGVGACHALDQYA